MQFARLVLIEKRKMLFPLAKSRNLKNTVLFICIHNSLKPLTILTNILLNPNPWRATKTFYFIIPILILALSLAILAHSLFSYPVLHQLEEHPTYDPTQTCYQWPSFCSYKSPSYLIFLFTFSLLSTTTIVFTIASLYTLKPMSFSRWFMCTLRFCGI